MSVGHAVTRGRDKVLDMHAGRMYFVLVVVVPGAYGRDGLRLLLTLSTGGASLERRRWSRGRGRAKRSESAALLSVDWVSSRIRPWWEGTALRLSP
jgi:hypothetical protein